MIPTTRGCRTIIAPILHTRTWRHSEVRQLDQGPMHSKRWNRGLEPGCLAQEFMLLITRLMMAIIIKKDYYCAQGQAVGGRAKCCVLNSAFLLLQPDFQYMMSRTCRKETQFISGGLRDRDGEAEWESSREREEGGGYSGLREALGEVEYCMSVLCLAGAWKEGEKGAGDAGGSRTGPGCAAGAQDMAGNAFGASPWPLL